MLWKTFTGENITPVGVPKANIGYKGQQPLLLDLYVVKGKDPVLTGKDLLYKTGLLRLVCHQITESFTSYTNCQQASAHHARQIMTQMFWKINFEHSNQPKESEPSKQTSKLISTRLELCHMP